uniref:EOG090X0G12 n=1 Tax=Megafenestra aurita TaxID=2291010 RepID=A0A4Y7NHM9_9CRUS|nr:EOG090X0G12 [Megafenestra aurita]
MESQFKAGSKQPSSKNFVILPLNDNKHYDCLLTGRDYIVHIALPNYPSFKECSVHYDWELKIILNKVSDLDFENLQKNCNIEKFLDGLVSLLDKHNLDNTLPIVNRVDQAYLTNYSNILNEIEEIGWEKLYCVNFNFTEIKLKMFDSKRNQHILTIKLNGSIPELFAEYPCHLNYEWHKDSTLKEIYNFYCDAAEQYQEFWQVMEELDNQCWVLEPENPSKCDTYRKISISANVSLKIDIDPNHPRYFPSITWLGSETAIISLREKVLDRLEVWDNELPIHVNLERLLEITLPLKDNLETKLENHEVTCCICYSERLNGQVPSRTCDNSQCGQSFHTYCLYEWLRNLIQTTRKQGNKVFGTCPYCEQPISCKPPDN